MLSFIPLSGPLRVAVVGGSGFDASGGLCVAADYIEVSGGGCVVRGTPLPFSAAAPYLAQASGGPYAWDAALRSGGRLLAVSVLVRTGDRVLVLRRKPGLAVSTAPCTASVTGTAVIRDASELRSDPAGAAARRELYEETGLSEADGALRLLGLALAPGKLQPAALFDFAFSGTPEELLRRVLEWPGFREEHEGAEVLPPEEALERPLTPVSVLAVRLAFGAAGRGGPAVE